MTTQRRSNPSPLRTRQTAGAHDGITVAGSRPPRAERERPRHARAAQQSGSNGGASLEAPVAVPDGAALPPPAGKNLPVPRERDNRSGRFLPGNIAAIKHALQTERELPGLELLRAEVQALLEQSLADDGGRDEMIARRASLHEYRARLHRRFMQIDAALELQGITNRQGKLRVAWLQQLHALVTKIASLDSMLGLERRQKRVGEVPALDEYLERRQRQPGSVD